MSINTGGNTVPALCVGPINIVRGELETGGRSAYVKFLFLGVHFEAEKLEI
jgi:hypothetical protein